MKAPGILRKEANSFLHIHALVLISGLSPNFDRLFHWQGAGRRRGSAEAVGAHPGLVWVEAVSSPPSSDSDSVSVRSRGRLMIGAASRKLKDPRRSLCQKRFPTG